MMKLIGIIFLLTFSLVDGAHQCYSCSGLCNCLQPSVIDCPHHTQCYTVKRSDDGKIVRKGCTAECGLVNDFNMMCTLCRGPTCNTETNLTPMEGSYHECQNELGNQGINQPPGLGQQMGQPQLGQGIGQSQGLGQGINQPGGLGQGIDQRPSLDQPYASPGNNNLGGQLNYKPAPSIGSQRYEDNLGNQGYQGLGNQGFNNQGLGSQGYNSAMRYGSNLLALGAAAVLGFNRL